MATLIDFFNRLSEISRTYLDTMQEKHQMGKRNLVHNKEGNEEVSHPKCRSSLGIPETDKDSGANKKRQPFERSNAVSAMKGANNCDSPVKGCSEQDIGQNTKGFSTKKLQEKDLDKTSELNSPRKSSKEDETRKQISKDEAQKAKTLTDFNGKCCGKIFLYPSHLKRHMSSFLHQNSVKCHMCGERFMSKDELSTHQETIHGKVGTSFICQICHKKFATNGILSRHIVCIHGEERPFQCEKCPYATSTKDRLMRHFRRRHIATENQYTCGMCGLTFENKSAVSTHIRAVHDKNREQCRKCFRTFEEKFELDLHMKCHLAGKNYLCQVCGQAFKKASHRERHHMVHTRPPKKPRMKRKRNYKKKQTSSGKKGQTSIRYNLLKNLRYCASAKKNKSHMKEKNMCEEAINFKKHEDGDKVVGHIEDVEEGMDVHVDGDEDVNVVDLDEDVNVVDEDVDVESLSGEVSCVVFDGLSEESNGAAIYIVPDQVEMLTNDSSIEVSSYVVEDSSSQNIYEGMGGPQLEGGVLLCEGGDLIEPFVISASQLSDQSDLNVQSVMLSNILANVSSIANEGVTFHNTTCVTGLADKSETVCHDASSKIDGKKTKSSSLRNVRKSSLKSSTSITKEKRGKRKNKCLELREITLQESNVPRRLKTQNKLPVECVPYLETTLGQDLSETVTLSFLSCSEVPEQIPSSIVSSENTVNENLLVITDAPCVSDENNVSVSTNSLGFDSMSLKKCKQKSVQRSKRKQSSKNFSKKDMPGEPRVFVTNVSDESDVFLLPEFFTEEDVENYLPSDDEPPLVYAVSSHDTNSCA